MRIIRKYWWLLVLVLVAAVGSFLWPRLVRGKTTDAAAAVYTPVRATRGPLAIEVEAAGKVTPADVVDLTPTGAGKVAEVLVEAGDVVRAGQVLVRLDAVDAEMRLRQAEDAYAVAQEKLRTTRESAALSPNQARMELERARASYASAKAKLDELQSGPTAEEITQAEASVNQARLSMAQSEREYQRMQRLYTQQAVTKQQLESAENSYLTAKESLASAEAKLKQLQNPPKPEEIAAAEATLAQAKVELEIAEENYRTAGKDYEVAAAEAEVKKARDELLAARRDAAGMVLQAPFSGIVIEVNARVGSYVGAQTSPVSLARGSELVVEAEVDENDVSQVQVGQVARITIPALEDKEYTGKVLSVGRYGEEKEGVVSFPVRVSLSVPDGLVKAGMNADVTIVVAERPDAIRVPNGAIETRMGRTTVRLYRDAGKVEYRRVEIGMRTDTMTEIVEGLREGEMVAVPGATSTSTSTSNSGGAGENDRRNAPMMMFR